MKSNNNTVGERMARLETNIDYIKSGIDDLNNKLTKHIADEANDVACIRKESDEKYANKTVERIVYGMVGIILVTVLGAILYLIIK